MAENSKIILGIDPGTNVFGYSNIKITNNKIKLLNLGVVKLDQLAGPYEKLSKIFEDVNKLIQANKPNEMAIEAPFFGKNVQSMLKLGRAQGVAIAAALTNNVPVFEYAPKKVKQSITGNGNASKDQLAAMVKSLTNLQTIPKYFDATDALGVAICHHFQGNTLANSGTKKFKDWKSFLDEHPDRLK